MRSASSFVSVFLLIACGGPAADPSDAGEPDAGGPADAGPIDPDAAPADGSTPIDARTSVGVWRYRDIGRGILPSLAIADDGAIHVGHARVFTDGTGRVLHSRSLGGAFETSVVAEGRRVGWNVELALAGAEPRIAYSDPTIFSEGTGQIYLAQRGGSRWEVAALPPMDHASFPIALAYFGDIGALAYDGATPTIARSDVGPWAAEPIGEPVPVTMRGVALAVDAGGDAHVAYIADDVVTYGRGSSSGWVVEAVDTAAAGYAVDLALGPGDRPCVAYGVEGSPWVAERTGSGWTRSSVGSVTELFDLAIAVDRDGVAHVAFADDATREVFHTSGENGWEPFVIASTGEGGSFIDLALDPDGRPHIAYSVLGPETTLHLASR